MQAFAIWMFMLTVFATPAVAETVVETACGADRYEPNNGRARAKSTRDKRVDGRTCRGDVDWFYFKAKKGQMVEVVVGHPVGSPVELDLYPPRARKPHGERGSHPGETRVRYRVKATAKHRVRVRAVDGKATAYTLEVVEG